ncbi:MAG: hydroxymethylbilane synthase [Flavipsychrobacter sp.]|nr:hydroxymethylbilane synthase [Flavipsychrobacter sp.]
MNKIIRIGTRDSQLAVWQATLVQSLLKAKGFQTELVPLKSDGDIDLVTPLYAMGVQGVFTKTLDSALLSDRFDLVVHSMKDVPTQMAQGIVAAAVLPRASHKDLLVPKNGTEFLSDAAYSGLIATSSIRRKAQWLNRYPHHRITNLRGNVNTRLRKLSEEDWDGAIFAAAGLERINLRPESAIELDWMLPAPAQGAILVVCREADTTTYEACALLNDPDTALCANIERDFLKTLMGGCSTPISALAEIEQTLDKEGNSVRMVRFRGNIFSLDGEAHLAIEKTIALEHARELGTRAATELLEQGADKIVATIKNGN